MTQCWTCEGSGEIIGDKIGAPFEPCPECRREDHDAMLLARAKPVQGE